MNEILYKCEKHTKNFTVDYTPPKIAIQFDDNQINNETIEKVNKIDNYLTILSESIFNIFHKLDPNKPQKLNETEIIPISESNITPKSQSKSPQDITPKSVTQKKNSKIMPVKFDEGKSSYFKAITREKFEILLNKGKCNLSPCMHRPRFTLLETYFLRFYIILIGSLQQ